MRPKRKYTTTLLSATLLLLLCGCASHGPKRLGQDRFDYNSAIADSWRTQTLLNIVRLRYLDWPMFLDVEQVVGQYTWEHVGSAKAIIKTPFSGDNDQGELGYVGKFSERPVILYKPLKGKQYMQSMLTPIPPGALLALAYTGWPIGRLLEIMSHSINGRRNTQIEYGDHLHPDPAFARFIQILSAYQRLDALEINVSSRKITDSKKEKVETKIEFRMDKVNEHLRKELEDIKPLLGMDPYTNSYKVIWGSLAPNRQTIVMETRSVLQLLVVLSAYVEVHEKEIEEGRVAILRPIPTENMSGLLPLMQIRRGQEAPSDAFASCVYRGRKFWIDDTDVNSKRTFSYLSLLLTIGSTDGSEGAQLVITTN